MGPFAKLESVPEVQTPKPDTASNLEPESDRPSGEEVANPDGILRARDPRAHVGRACSWYNNGETREKGRQRR